jgi:nucleotide-binding universal stress UspA family protein
MKTSKISKILIALDYGPTAQKVAELGYAMAKTMAAKIFLLHVVSNPLQYSAVEYSPIMGFTGYQDMGPMQSENVDELKNASQHFLDKSKQHLGDETIQTLVKEGEVAESILKAAKDLHIDMIVMGSHSRKWLENIVMGSVTEKVINHSSLPLVIIPTKKQSI